MNQSPSRSKIFLSPWFTRPMSKHPNQIPPACERNGKLMARMAVSAPGSKWWGWPQPNLFAFGKDIQTQVTQVGFRVCLDPDPFTPLLIHSDKKNLKCSLLLCNWTKPSQKGRSGHVLGHGTHMTSLFGGSFWASKQIIT